MPFNQTSQPRPQAPRVGDSQLSSTKRRSCTSGSSPSSFSEPMYSSRMFSGLGFITTRSEEHTSELQSLMRISYAVFCLKKKKNTILTYRPHKHHTLKQQTTSNEH